MKFATLLPVAAAVILAAQIIPNIAWAQAQPARRFPVFWERSSLLPAVRSTLRHPQASSTLR
jgi:hypothetical protein